MEAAEGGPRGAALVARERLPVGRVDVRVHGAGRAPLGAEVVARERVSVGLEDFVRSQAQRASKGDELGAGERRANPNRGVGRFWGCDETRR